VRDALEKLHGYPGIMADYAPPFTPSRHDALGPEIFQLGRYDASGRVIPVGK
jgi:branched-chain amino acid transport system substrate-binding protein